MDTLVIRSRLPVVFTSNQERDGNEGEDRARGRGAAEYQWRGCANSRAGGEE